MTLALSIAAASGSALLRRIEAASADLARASVPAHKPLLGRTPDGFLTIDNQLVEPPVQVPSFITTLSLEPDGLVTGLDPESPEMPMPLGHVEPNTAPFLDPMRALMDLVALQRAFELNNKIIQAADDVLQGINTLRRKP